MHRLSVTNSASLPLSETRPRAGDPKIGVALKMMHQKLDATWTVKKLASACGMSRSAFALRFKEMVRRRRWTISRPGECRRPQRCYIGK